MVTVLLGSMPLCVFASDLNDGVNDGYDRFMGGHKIKGFNTWESTDKKSFTLANIVSFFASIGMYFKGMSNECLMDILIEHLIESGRIADAESTDEYIASHLTANEEETELYLSNDFTNALYETSVQYIEENTGYFVYKTGDYSQLLKYYASYFDTSQQMDALRNYIAGSESSAVFILSNTKANIELEDGTKEMCYMFYEFDMADKNIVYTKGTYNKFLYGLLYSSETWLDVSNEQKYMYIKQDGTILQNTNSKFTALYCNTYGDALNFSGKPYYYWPYEIPPIDKTNTYTIDTYGLVSRNGVSYRVYWSLDDMKEYSVGNRPYYATSDFYNYNSSDDNSTTITQTEIDNSITYGDVYNYIINNYENPDGLTEDELRAILEEYLSQIGGGSGSGSGSGGGSGGSDDGGSSGGGLGSFLEGLGSVGDAILSILGKLLEYIGKALELLTGTVTKVLDLIPSNITNLLLGLFPFIPQEWVTAIELSLVLGVVLAVVGAFKK